MMSWLCFRHQGLRVTTTYVSSIGHVIRVNDTRDWRLTGYFKNLGWVTIHTPLHISRGVQLSDAAECILVIVGYYQNICVITDCLLRNLQALQKKTKRERERDVLQYVFLNELIMVWDFTFNLHLYRLQACTCTLLVLMSLDMLVPVAKSLTTSLPHTQLTSSPAGEEKQRQTNKMFLGVFVRVYKTAKKEIQ